MLTPYLQVEGLTKSFGDLVLFSGISFGVAQGQRVGLIARNGAGKSTLLNVLAGIEGYDEGNVVYKNDLRVGYLCQRPIYPAGLTVLEACFYETNDTLQLIREYEQCLETPGTPELDALLDRMEHADAWNYEQRAKQILTSLHITDYNQKVETLSGGQLKRVALANVLIGNPDMLILDEPTNHLDLPLIEWLEDYLTRSTATLLMVTHDRYFLDNVCNEILEIDDHTVYSYKGNYSYYLAKREERVEARNTEIARANNLYRTELEWMRRMPQARGHKARYREEAFYELEKVAKQRVVNDRVQLNVKSSYIGSKIFEADGLSLRFGDRCILDRFSYVFSRYEKLGIVGDNGTGKSSFLKLLMGQIAPDSGHLDIGETVRFGYYSQEGLQFDTQMKVIDVAREIAEVIPMAGGKQLTASQFLQHFLFPPEKQHSYVYKLSGGECRRLYLCTVLMRNPNFLILDEPTNDLDILTLQVLEEYLRDFAGCVIVVSHDRYFMDKIVDHLLVFNGQGDIRDFPGNYTQYREWKEEVDRQRTIANRQQSQQKNVSSSQKIVGSSSLPVDNKSRKKTFKERQEFAAVEKTIVELEAEKTAIEEALCTGSLTADELTTKSIRLSTLNEELDEITMRWLELSEIPD